MCEHVFRCANVHARTCALMHGHIHEQMHRRARVRKCVFHLSLPLHLPLCLGPSLSLFLLSSFLPSSLPSSLPLSLWACPYARARAHTHTQTHIPSIQDDSPVPRVLFPQTLAPATQSSQDEPEPSSLEGDRRTGGRGRRSSPPAPSARLTPRCVWPGRGGGRWWMTRCLTFFVLFFGCFGGRGERW